LVVLMSPCPRISAMTTTLIPASAMRVAAVCRRS
jgi:hypothetical protein